MTSAHEVDLWCVQLHAPPDVVDAHAARLAADERVRTAAFRFDELRRRFIITRGSLRHLLGMRTGVDPAAITFTYAEGGKPSLANGGLHFNLSHAEEVAVFAFCATSEIGVDVEYIRPIDGRDAISRRFFSAAECGELGSLPESERTLAFYHCWTRKEAYVKAIGQGLSHPLDRFTVSVRPGARAALLEVDGDADAGSRWLMHSFIPAEGYVAAVAVAAPAIVNELRCVDAAGLLRC